MEIGFGISSYYRPINLTCIESNGKIVEDEPMLRCGHLIDPRHHCFLKDKYCTANYSRVDFCDSLAPSLKYNIRSDAIYFDFAKAFDSANHDLILKKLSPFFEIDGFILRFIFEYLRNREQSLVISGFIIYKLFCI